MYVLCKQGNDSQKAVKLLQETLCRNTDKFFSNETKSLSTEDKQDIQDKNTSLCDVVFKDIAGGLHAWAKHIDKDFPVY